MGRIAAGNHGVASGLRRGLRLGRSEATNPAWAHLLESLPVLTAATGRRGILFDFSISRRANLPIKDSNKPTASKKYGGKRTAETSVALHAQNVSHLHGIKNKGLVAWLRKHADHVGDDRVCRRLPVKGPAIQGNPSEPFADPGPAKGFFISRGPASFRVVPLYACRESSIKPAAPWASNSSATWRPSRSASAVRRPR